MAKDTLCLRSTHIYYRFRVQSLRQNHFSETHSRPACGYLLSVYAPQSSGEFPCAVCRTGVGSNSIFCNGCKHWVHKKCSGVEMRLKKDPDYRCTRCQGSVCPLDGRQQKSVQGGLDKLEVVASFCYLGDMLSAAEGCELPTTTCVKSAWKKFKDLLPALSSHHLSFKTRGRVYSSCVPARLRLRHWHSQTASVCIEMTGQWSNRSAMSGHKKSSVPDTLSYLCDLALRIWTSFWRSVWTFGTH